MMIFNLCGETTMDKHIKALKRLYALCSLKKAGLSCDDLVLVYCSLVRSVIEYASPVWAALLLYLEDLLESIQSPQDNFRQDRVR